jgi:hypothetical protein
VEIKDNHCVVEITVHKEYTRFSTWVIKMKVITEKDMVVNRICSGETCCKALAITEHST